MAAILHVESDDSQRELYSGILRGKGYGVVEAKGGAEALERLGKKGMDLVVLGLGLDGDPSLDLIPQILGRHKKMPIIIHTAYAVYRDNWRSWSADAFIVKQKSGEELCSEVGRILAKKRS